MTAAIAEVILNRGREKSVLRHHPWLFSGAIAKVNGNPKAGATVTVRSAGGELLGYGAYSPASQLRVRMWDFGPDAASPDGAFFQEKVTAAWAYRAGLALTGPERGFRLIASENDGLPGVTVDWYDGFAVMQLSSAGAEAHRAELVAALQMLPEPPKGLWERSDLAVRAREGLAERCGLLAGAEPPERIRICEGERTYWVDVRHGHKTGFYCDQRENRDLVEAHARGKRVLNLFSYTGGFGVAVWRGGASEIVNVDSSAEALALGRENFRLNGAPDGAWSDCEADVFSLLRKFRGEHRQFDLIVLDPPKLVDSPGALNRGARAYKDAALQSLHLLAPGGMLFTFSCSGLVTPELFAKITADAALDAHCELAIVRRLTQAADHPVAVAFPEGLYLKGLWCIKR